MTSSRLQTKSGTGGVPAGYPSHLERTFITTSGQKLFLRPILPEDGPRLMWLFFSLSPDTIYKRFHGHIRTLSEASLKQLVNVNYRSQLALLAIEPEQDSVIAVARYHRGEEGRVAELALVVVDEWQGHGVGTHLLEELIAAARANSITGFKALVLSGNSRVKKMIQSLGYRVHSDVESGVDRLRFNFNKQG